ncbi:3-deoxy-7-phosphoheptulonate synthase [Sporolituus thermophilus]|uniref:3-deoxy-D-arabinoheptulosonate-7-phosphate synthase n=1 Tax=Sporolituus thermophilus DSM 23256 TaxID=1123285 RepID=A0A1G7JLT9_9FIRM|nr:3-deoxy-7-phosphoheptulonate synthase [Sporolituus thermophilus]SDF25815.1 3-deoxy-D-arabinoheptulosonate-7-phosphate synthase [Sporolituus thermophilus DSM 23256]
MIIIMNRPTDRQIERIMAKLAQKGIETYQLKSGGKTIIAVTDHTAVEHAELFERMPGVEKVVAVSKPFKLASREFRREDTQVAVKNVIFGAKEIPVIAGPCAVESYEQLHQTAIAVKQAGARMLRGGAYKPRTSPYSFQGLEKEGLEILQAVGRETGLPVITEVTDTRAVELVADYADMLQIGARNMQNFALLKEVAQIKKPVLLKRGVSATVEEWLMAAEYIMVGGNEAVVLCERGIRSFETYTRNTLDLSVVPLIKHLSHFPIIVDPSHGTGKWRLVGPMAKAAVAAGADGLLIEVHPWPEDALSDGPQSLTPANFNQLMQELADIAQAVGRNI